MNLPHNGVGAYQHALERKQAELGYAPRTREGIVIEKSADPMDQIQYAPERDLAIGNVDRESDLLRQVKAALERIRDGTYGNCLDCEAAISPKRLAALPWATRCIRCQTAADVESRATSQTMGARLAGAA